MTDPDDLMLAALFQDCDDDQANTSGPAFTLGVMAQVIEAQSKRKLLIDTTVWSMVACVAVVCIVVAPSAWQQIEGAWLKSTAAYNFNNQSLILVGILLLSGLSWAMAVRD